MSFKGRRRMILSLRRAHVVNNVSHFFHLLVRIFGLVFTMPSETLGEALIPVINRLQDIFSQVSLSVTPFVYERGFADNTRFQS